MGDQFITEAMGILAGVLTSTSILPQVIKKVREKKADDISMVMLIILLCGIVDRLWNYEKRPPHHFTNSFSFLINIVLIALRIKYKNRIFL
jgi:MtN3 and saliva related transmembrane protein